MAPDLEILQVFEPFKVRGHCGGAVGAKVVEAAVL
jgi:hypothetical protein